MAQNAKDDKKRREKLCIKTQSLVMGIEHDDDKMEQTVYNSRWGELQTS